MLKVGSVVVIKKDINHDVGYAGQFGVVCEKHPWPNPDTPTADWWSDYYVLAWDNRENRFWECGFKESELEYQNHGIMPFLQHLQFWMNSQHSLKTGMKLKPNKFGEKYEYYLVKKEKGSKKAAK